MAWSLMAVLVVMPGQVAGAQMEGAPPSSEAVPNSDFCADLSLGGPRLFPFDSDGDGVADVCSLPSTRREAVARQQAMEMVATEHAERFLALVDRACGEVGLRSFGDDVEDLAGDVCETGRLAGFAGRLL